MPRPNFLVIGPHKSGTTSLHRYLQQHPQVFLPDLKEPRFFSYNPGEPPAPSSPYAWGETRHPITSWAQYLELFERATEQRAVGEVSPCYLNNPYAPVRVREALPDVRLIASLRDPADRAWSDYLMAVRNGRETRPFMDIMDARSDWHATLAYVEPCRRWLAHFPRQRLAFIRAEQLQSEPAAELKRLFAFLEVDAGFTVDASVRLHQSGTPRSRPLHRILSGRHVQALRPYVPGSVRGLLRPLKNANLQSAPRLDSGTRARLVELLSDHIRRLEDLLDMEFPEWLQIERAPADLRARS